MSVFGGFPDSAVEASGSALAPPPGTSAPTNADPATLQALAAKEAIPTDLVKALLRALGSTTLDEDLLMKAVDFGLMDESEVVTAVANMVDDNGAAIPGLKRAPAMRLFRSAKLLAHQHGLGDAGPPAVVAVPAKEAPSEQASEPTRKACEVIDQADDSVFVVLGRAEADKLRERYAKAVGDDPPDVCRPTTDQLSALKHKLGQGRAPYVDLALFGPFGDRIGKSMKFAAQVFVDGALRTKQVSPPSSYEAWVGSWDVFRSAMIMLGAATPASLDKYAMGIKRLWATHGRWSVIQTAEDKCRAEQWEVLAEKFSRNAPADFDDRAPWNSIIAASSYSPSGGPLADWWYYQVVAPLTYHTGQPSHAMNVFEGTTGTVTEFVGAGAASSGGGGKGAARRANVDRKRNRGQQANVGPPAGVRPAPSNAKETCENWNNGRCSEPCPHGRLHVCRQCGGPHRAPDCNRKKPAATFENKKKKAKKGDGKGSSKPAA